MDAKERIRKAMHQEPTDRPPCICPGGMMNMITTDLMDEANVSWPEAHLNARMMADLAEANYEKGCFENVGVPFCMTIEAESMGAKITIDSATMMNKGLEIIEARWLFDVQPENIDVVVHRESIIHSLIEYVDNSVIAQLGLPDMRIPIQYAITYPERYESPVGELSLAQIGKMTFFEPDYDTFKCLRACKKALSLGGVATAIANGANEEANRLFREGKITFLEIGDLVMGAIDNIDNFEPLCVDDVLKADKLAREYVLSKL